MKTNKPEVEFLPDGSVLFNSGQSLTNIHEPSACAGRHCPIHNPSDHELRGAYLFFNGRHMVRRLRDELFLDPDDYYASLGGEAILRNSATCALCGDMIQSKTQHDFRSCKCGEIFVDGGAFYIRRGANDMDNIIDTSIVVRLS